jgi:hypothetical protein
MDNSPFIFVGGLKPFGGFSAHSPDHPLHGRMVVVLDV